MKKIQNRRGFTLIELIVVMAIMAIIAGTAVSGLIHYQRFATYKQNNEHAETIFTAAQAQLTHYKAAGTLEDFVAQTKDQSKAVGAAIADQYYGRLQYVELTREMPQDQRESSAVYSLIGDSISDPSVLSAAVRIEYDPVTATVYSAAYTARTNQLVEEGAAGDSSTMSIDRDARSSSVRRQSGLGYYESSLPNIIAAEPEEENDGGSAVIEGAKLVNGERLQLELDYDISQSNLIQNSHYQVDLYETDQNGNNKKHKATINFAGGFGTAVKAATAVAGDTSENAYEYTYWTEITNNKLIIVLDAIDIEAARILQEALVNNTQDDLKPADYGATYSILRLGFRDSSKITATVITTDEDANPVTTIVNSEHPLMQGYITSNNYYQMNYSRHLFNVRFIDTYQAGKYVPTADLTWSGENSAVSNTAVFNNLNHVTGEDAYFAPIPSLQKGSSIQTNLWNLESSTVMNFNNFLIKPLTVADHSARRNITADGVGLVAVNNGGIGSVQMNNAVINTEDKEIKYIGGVAGVNAANAKLVNTVVQALEIKSSGDWVGGITGLNEGEVRSDYSNSTITKVENYQVSGRNNVGGLIGENRGMFWNYQIWNSTVTGSGDYAGGAIGRNSAALEWNSIDAWEANLIVTGQNYVGGLIGYTDQKITNFAAYRISVSGSGDNIGGLFGAADAEVTRWGQAFLSQINVSGVNNVGGLAGRITGAFQNYGITGSSEAFTTVTGTGDNVGGMVGSAEAGSSISRDNIQNVLRYLQVKGRSNVGGVAGLTAGTITNYSVMNSIISGNEAITAESENLWNWIGGIAGRVINRAEITCHTRTSLEGLKISGNAYVGGIAGSSDGRIFNYLIQSSEISGTGDYIGGIAGYAEGTDSNVSIDGSGRITEVLVAGRNYVGGITVSA